MAIPTTKLEHDILDLLPATTPDYAAPMWLGALQFALGDDWAVGRYRLIQATSGNLAPRRLSG